jgi:uncharacterized membrane protein YfbV (UPF0208 family)
MYRKNEDDPIPTTTTGMIGKCYQPTLTERLKRDQADLRSRLEEIDEAIAALEANPQVQAVLDLVQRVAR